MKNVFTIGLIAVALLGLAGCGTTSNGPAFKEWVVKNDYRIKPEKLSCWFFVKKIDVEGYVRAFPGWSENQLADQLWNLPVRNNQNVVGCGNKNKLLRDCQGELGSECFAVFEKKYNETAQPNFADINRLKTSLTGSEPSTAAAPEKKSEETISDNSQELIQISSGTGFAITNDGHIVTNNHVILGCSDILLLNDGSYVLLKIVSKDPLNDLAILKGDFTPSETFAIAETNPELMQDIYVAGYPFGRMVSTSVKVTRGIVSSLSGYGNNSSGLQIDAAIQPGNSGGPIFDNNGNVVGVVVSKLAKQGEIDPENTNFGIKANILANLLESNSVPFDQDEGTVISNTELSKKASDATFYLSCWNTIAEAKKMKTSKVMFSELD